MNTMIKIIILTLVISIHLNIAAPFANEALSEYKNMDQGKCDFLNSLLTLPDGYIQYQHERIESSDYKKILNIYSQYYKTIDGTPNFYPHHGVVPVPLYEEYIQCFKPSKEWQYQAVFNKVETILEKYGNMLLSNPEEIIKYIESYFIVINKNVYKNNVRIEDFWLDKIISKYNDLNHKMHSDTYDAVIDSANFFEKIPYVVNIYQAILGEINEVKNHTLNTDNTEYFLKGQKNIYTKYLGIINEITYKDSVKRFPFIIDSFEQFKEKYISKLEELNLAINELEKKFHQLVKQKQEEQRIKAEAEAKKREEQERLKKERLVQSIRTVCMPVVTEAGLNEEAYDYAIPTNGMMNMLHDGYVLFGEFICFAESGGALRKYSSPGLFSKSHKVVIPIKRIETTFEFIEESSTIDGKTILRLLNYEASSGESQKFMNTKEQEPVIGGLSFLLWINALQNNPARFNIE